MTRWVIDTDPGEDAVQYYDANILCYGFNSGSDRIPTCININGITSDTLDLSFDYLLTLVVF